jgi:hypothetical protein
MRFFRERQGGAGISRGTFSSARREDVRHITCLVLFCRDLLQEHNDHAAFPFPARRESDPFAALRGHSLRHRQGCGLGLSRGPFRPRACVAAAPDPAPAGRRHAATRSFSWQRTGKMSDRATLFVLIDVRYIFYYYSECSTLPRKGAPERRAGKRAHDPLRRRWSRCTAPQGRTRFSLVGGGCGVSQVSGSRARGSSVRRRYVFRRTFLL